MKKRKNKNEAGYIVSERNRQIVKTIILFVIPLSLFAAGILATRSRLNLLTIIAVLGMLPACKSAVEMIMYMKSHGITEVDYKEISKLTGSLLTSYDNVFTTYEKTYEVPSLVIRSGNICGYVQKEYKTLSELEKHITSCMKKEGIQVNVKIFDKKESYLNRLGSLQNLEETDEEQSRTILRIVSEITL